MTDVLSRDRGERVRSHQNSPVPRRQLSSLSVNQRSYSRMSSKSGFGDESPLLSPLPLYPRRRSVTFADDSAIREERPHYNATYSSSAPVSPVRRASPPPVPSILKSFSSYGGEDGADGERAEAAQPTNATAAGAATARSGRSSPMPTRGRSNSRQRIAARRKEAQLHHSFYDDSFVEEFVLTARQELEKEEEERRQREAQARAEREKAKKAEQRAKEEAEKISTLQQVKEALLAAAQRKRVPSPTPPREEQRVDKSMRPSKTTAAATNETDLLRSLEEDEDPAVQAALAELARCAGPPHGSRKRSLAKRRSVPIVSEDALLSEAEEESSGEEGQRERRKRAKLESMVAQLLEQHKKRKSKRSVMVIDWSDSDSFAAGPLTEDEESTDARVVPRGRSGKSRSVALASTAVAPTATTAGTRPSTSRRAASSRRRNVSAAPELGDSLLFDAEEEQPILLPRRQHRRPPPTRSISQLEAEGDESDDALLNSEAIERVVRKPPRTARPRANPPARRAAPGRATQAMTNSSVYNTSHRGDSTAPGETETAASTAPRRRRATADTAAARLAPPRGNPDDPMAVFFEAAFPSPSKFDELMMQAGGLPEARRGRPGGHGRQQPNLVLPSTIGRRR